MCEEGVVVVFFVWGESRGRILRRRVGRRGGVGVLTFFPRRRCDVTVGPT